MIGGGVKGTVATAAGPRDVFVGNQRLLESRGIDVAPLADAIRTAAAAGRTIALVAIDGLVAGVLTINDPVKAESAPAGFAN